jgi:P27 family predicted phage terminase small subunit
MPQRKARDRRQGRATADLGIVKAPVEAVPPIPHPRGGQLLAETAAAWATFWGSELAGLVTEADLPALVRLFRSYDLRERFARIVTRSPMVAGSKGQPRVNPAAGELASLDGRISALEDRFGLTPLARFRLGLTFGAAARSIEKLNEGFDDDDDTEDDPRLRVIDVDAAT